jgi:hypothetical protein
MLAVVLSLGPPILAGFLAARWACPGPRAVATLIFHVSLGTGLGFGFTSATHFLWLLSAGPSAPGLPAVEMTFFALLIFALAILNGRFDAASVAVFASSAHGLPRRIGAAFLAVSLCAFIVAAVQAWRSPHGDNDAYAIWNQRARFLYRGGATWREAFPHLEEWSHPDYPLLVPANVARCWAYAGAETTLTPQLLAVAFGAAVTGLLASGVALLRTPSQGFLAGIVLLATPQFVELTTAQYADGPLAFYVLAGVLLFEAYDRLERKPARLPLLAGLVIGMAAWTKNEGQLFLVATLAARGSAALRGGVPWPIRSKELLSLAVGLAPFLGCLAVFKLSIAPPNDLVAGQSLTATWQRLTTLGRYGTVGREFGGAVPRLFAGAAAVLPVYALLLGLNPRRPRPGRHTAVVLGAMLAGYTLIYLTTPHDLTWHVVSSADRLLMQLWPSAVLLFFLRVAAPEERRGTPSLTHRAVVQ